MVEQSKSAEEQTDAKPDAVVFDSADKTSPEAKTAGQDEGKVTAADLEAVFDVPVEVSAILGHCRMKVSDLIEMDEGTVLTLDRKVGESIDILINNRLVARGEVVLVDEKLGVTMTEIVKKEE